MVMTAPMSTGASVKLQTKLQTYYLLLVSKGLDQVRKRWVESYWFLYMKAVDDTR